MTMPIRALRLALLAALIGVAALALPAADAQTTTKPYSVVLSPSSVASGDRTTITATVKNLASRQTLGSANVTPPGGYRVVSATISKPPPASVSVVDNVVQLRTLGLGKNQSLVVTMTVDVPCAAGTSRWTPAAKQSNQFNGTGNDFTLTEGLSQLNTTATGSCGLAFVTQPAETRVGERITGVPLDPTGAQVAVRHVDGAGATRSSSSPVTLTSSPGTLAGTSTAAAVEGVATFGDISLASPGSYTLTASSTGSPSTTSNEFAVRDESTTTCQDNVDCTGTLTRTGTLPDGQTYVERLQVTAGDNPDLNQDGGTLRLGFNVTKPIDCAGYTEVSPDTGEFDGLNRPKTATTTTDRILLQRAGRTLASLKTCFGAPYDFPTGPFTRATPEDIDGDGHTDRFVGLLPDCFEVVAGLIFPPPCVESRSTDAAGNAVINVQAPADPRDPWIRR